MKFFYLLFAFYVTALAVYPCSDANTCADEKRIGEQVASVADHPHSTDEQDLCTPFCICSCCATHIRVSLISIIDVTVVAHNTKETIPYIEKRVLANGNHIWQPPKI